MPAPPAVPEAGRSTGRFRFLGGLSCRHCSSAGSHKWVARAKGSAGSSKGTHRMGEAALRDDEVALLSAVAPLVDGTLVDGMLVDGMLVDGTADDIEKASLGGRQDAAEPGSGCARDSSPLRLHAGCCPRLGK